VTVKVWLKRAFRYYEINTINASMDITFTAMKCKTVMHIGKYHTHYWYFLITFFAIDNFQM